LLALGGNDDDSTQACGGSEVVPQFSLCDIATNIFIIMHKMKQNQYKADEADLGYIVATHTTFNFKDVLLLALDPAMISTTTHISPSATYRHRCFGAIDSAPQFRRSTFQQLIGSSAPGQIGTSFYVL